MPLSDFVDCMPTSVTIKPVTALDKYGEKTYGTAQTIKAKIMERNERLAITGGEEIVARGRVILGAISSPTVTTKDQLTLPDGSTPEILAVQPVNDEVGLHHEVIIFK